MQTKYFLSKSKQELYMARWISSGPIPGWFLDVYDMEMKKWGTFSSTQDPDKYFAERCSINYPDIEQISSEEAAMFMFEYA